MPNPTLLQALADAKLRPVLIAWAQRNFMDDQLDFLIDLNAKRPAKHLYETYIVDTAPKLINIEARDLRPMRELVKARGEAAFTDKAMWEGLGKAGEEVINFLTLTFAGSSKQGFYSSPEFLAYQAGTLTNDEHVEAALTALRLPAPKAKLIEPLIDTYLKARTPSDAYEAYEAMQKIAPKTRVDLALTAAGKPAAEVVEAAKAKKLAEANAKETAKLVSTLKTDVAAALKYLESALKATKDKAKFKTVSPAEKTRMFNSGRLRVEKVTTAYAKAVTYDKAFATKNPVLAASKKKMDEQWGEYREAIGK